MCRKNQLLGCVLLSFGLGLLLGSLISSGFWCCCLAMGIGGLGFVVLRIN